MDEAVLSEIREALKPRSSRPVYLRLADRLEDQLNGVDGDSLPSARELAGRLGVNRATTTAAYRELARRGLLELRRGRRTGPASRPASHPAEPAEPPRDALDLARYAPDRELLPAGRVFEWLGLGEGEGEAVAQYGDPRGYRPLRDWLRARLARDGVELANDELLLTSGVQHGLDLLLRALAKPGDGVVVEDPSYPGLPPLLRMHSVRPRPVEVGLEGLDVDALAVSLKEPRPRLAILTPTLQNPTGTVMDDTTRAAVLGMLETAGVRVVEELFDPGLVADGPAPRPLAALSSSVVLVGSFSKALFPGLRVGWLAAPREVVQRVAAVKLATDLSGSTFLEAAAFQLCRRGVFDRQLARLRTASRERTATVLEILGGDAPDRACWSRPRGGFSLLLGLPAGWSSEAVAARAAAAGVWVLPGPVMSVSGRDDVLRIAFAAVGGERLRDGMHRLVTALRPREASVALV